jgi:hypothetical protein
MKKGPKIIHNTDKEKTEAVRRIIAAFSGMLQAEAKHMFEKKEIENDDLILTENLELEEKTLLKTRKKLVAAIKQGMLEKKDQEIKIGVYSALVWASRIERERRKKILENDLFNR